MLLFFSLCNNILLFLFFWLLFNMVLRLYTFITMELKKIKICILYYCVQKLKENSQCYVSNSIVSKCELTIRTLLLIVTKLSSNYRHLILKAVLSDNCYFESSVEDLKIGIRMLQRISSVTFPSFLMYSSFLFAIAY